MGKWNLIVLAVLVLLLGSGLMATAESKDKDKDNDVHIGGHIKMSLYDKSFGTSTVSGVDYDNADKGTTGFSSHTFILFISKNITDNLAIEIDPDYTLGSAGATPSLGKKIGEQRKSTSSSYSNSNAGNIPNLRLYQEYVKYNLPDYKLELKAGYINCLFTWDYGKELFWHEQINGGKASLYLGSWHDTGIEAYRNFELGAISMPVYLYLLNGSGGTSYTDNNSDKTIMFHVEPEFSGKLAGLKTFASYGFGNYGDAEYLANYTTVTTVPAALKNKKYMRWALGASYAYQQFNVRAEYLGGIWQKYYNFGAATEEDQGKNGFLFKVFYKIIPDKLTGMLAYDVYNTEANAAYREEYKTTTIGAQYELATAATLIFAYDMADWKDDQTGTSADALDFNRVTMGLRITF
ncbi:MAG: hypothetical protein HY762_05990 [Planctomycetes bacterium]|nr:hypothetical protein [Planctomycetota bacterium]